MKVGLYRCVAACSVLFLNCRNVFASDGAVENGDSILAEYNGAAKNALVTKAGDQILGIFGSVYSLLTTIGVIIAVIGMIIAFVELAVSNGRVREMAKGRMLSVSFALILIGGSVAIINMFLSFGR